MMRPQRTPVRLTCCALPIWGALTLLLVGAAIGHFLSVPH